MYQVRTVAGIALASATLFWTGSALAQLPSIDVTGAYHFLDNRGDNGINIFPGLRQQFGAAAVIPNGNAGTTATATQGAAGPFALNFQPFNTLPNHFVTSRPASAVPNGQWTLVFNSPGFATTTVLTPGIGTTPPQIDFAKALSMSGAIGSPTFAWTAPTTPFDTQRLVVYDLADIRGNAGINGNGVAQIILNKDIGPSTRSFTLSPSDPGLQSPLQFNRPYSLEIELRDLRNNAGANSLANTLSQSRTFFDFMLLPVALPGPVFLPTTNTTNPGSPVYNFTAVPVTVGQPVFIDPLVAFGYDYEIGLGDPNFASVKLPTGIGDNLFDLLRWNGTDWVFDSTLIGGIEHLFGPLGVDRFRITGIETSANLDPFDNLAFISELTFTGDGTFNGSMTPLTVDVPAVPLGPLPLPVSGLALLGFWFWQRRRQASAPA